MNTALSILLASATGQQPAGTHGGASGQDGHAFAQSLEAALAASAAIPATPVQPNHGIAADSAGASLRRDTGPARGLTLDEAHPAGVDQSVNAVLATALAALGSHAEPKGASVHGSVEGMVRDGPSGNRSANAGLPLVGLGEIAAQESGTGQRSPMVDAALMDGEAVSRTASTLPVATLDNVQGLADASTGGPIDRGLSGARVSQNPAMAGLQDGQPSAKPAVSAAISHQQIEAMSAPGTPGAAPPAAPVLDGGRTAGPRLGTAEALPSDPSLWQSAHAQSPAADLSPGVSSPDRTLRTTQPMSREQAAAALVEQSRNASALVTAVSEGAAAGGVTTEGQEGPAGLSVDALAAPGEISGHRNPGAQASALANPAWPPAPSRPAPPLTKTATTSPGTVATAIGGSASAEHQATRLTSESRAEPAPVTAAKTGTALATAGSAGETALTAPADDLGERGAVDGAGADRLQPVALSEGDLQDGLPLERAASASPTRAPVLPGPPTAGAQIALQISRSVPDGVNHLSVRLQPAELGSVDIQLSFEEAGRLTAHIIVERPETLELLQRDSRLLERSLADSGLKLGQDGLNFTLKQDQQQHQTGQQFHDQAQARQAAFRAGRAYDEAPTSEQPPLTRRVDGLRLLDIET